MDSPPAISHTDRSHTDTAGRFTATDTEAALILDLTLAAYGDGFPFRIHDLDHVLAISGCDTHWLVYALNERVTSGLLAVGANGIWQVIDSAALRSHTTTISQADVATGQLPAGMSDEEALNLTLALWADGHPFWPDDLKGLLTFTGQSWIWLLAHLAERVAIGLLAYNSSTGYQVIAPDALKNLVLKPSPTIENTPTPVSSMARPATRAEGEDNPKSTKPAALVPTYSGHAYTLGPDEADAVLDHALGFFADGSPFPPAALVDVLDITGQTRTWLLRRLINKTSTGLLERDVEQGTYTVIDAARICADAYNAELVLAGQIDEAEPEDDLIGPASDRLAHILDVPTTRPSLTAHPATAAITAQACPKSGEPSLSVVARTRTIVGLAMLALFFAISVAAPLPLVAGVLVAIAAFCLWRD
ncbi:hypothetical protein OG339_48125 (plasmid) [Streptosporangium sp. NBC_01495]|uniref:hypothetical protein n=1 Tax=Streptosporangium sp. NBC_01495 TaxID=2903899 RepID=UPI002E3670D8|nr:hypothetical protein [Streptosporangium sp. NBC_01495]